MDHGRVWNSESLVFWMSKQESCKLYHCPERTPPIWSYPDFKNGIGTHVHDMQFKIECGKMNSYFIIESYTPKILFKLK